MTDQPKPSAAGGADRDATVRDARLAQALRHMPDAHMQPSAQTRQAVLQAALQAAGAGQATPPSAPRRWWQRWVGQPDQPGQPHKTRHGGPWSAALASVLVVGFVAVLWQGQEVPDAEPALAPQPRPAAVRPDTAAKPTLEAPAPASVVADALKDKPAKKRDAVLARANPPRKTAVAPEAAVAQAPRRMESPAANVPPPPANPIADGAATATANTNTESEPRRRLAASPAAAPAATSGGLRADARESDARVARPSQSVQPGGAMAPASAKARADTQSTVRLTLGDVPYSVQPAKAQKLVNLLRSLPYGLTTTAPQPAELQGGRLQVEWAGQGIWVITPGTVIHRQLGAGPGPGQASNDGAAASVSAITPAQYAQLRALVLELATQP